MKKRMIWVTVALVFLSGSYALARESLIEHLVNACENDIESYCSQVTPGDGRLLLCMAAHEDKISGQCVYAFYQAASLLEQLSVAISYIAQECETEIATLCRDVEMGEGRVLACLDGHEEDVGESCKRAISNTVTESKE